MNIELSQRKTKAIAERDKCVWEFSALLHLYDADNNIVREQGSFGGSSKAWVQGE
jgi:hypothetical protein